MKIAERQELLCKEVLEAVILAPLTEQIVDVPVLQTSKAAPFCFGASASDFEET